jgi:catechol 2,3-dioxygenase
MDPAAHIGAVHLTISNLDRAVGFYESRLGFAVHRREGRTAHLGAGGPDLLVLSESATARRPHGTTGLYHFAILVPSRADLGRALRRLVDTRTVLQGAADHGVSEALYLADPDGNGIEIYRDRPREQWPFVGVAEASAREGVTAGALAKAGLRMGADPLDLDGILAEPDRTTGNGLAPAAVIGHVHLHVSHLDAAERFYVGVLGFDLMQRYGPSALFVSAGGYHHHIGLNTWAGVGAPPPAGAIGLEFFVVELPDATALGDTAARLDAAGVPSDRDERTLRTHDPSGNVVKFCTPGSRLLS